MHQQNITLRSKIVSLLNAVTDPQMTKKNKRKQRESKKNSRIVISHIIRGTENEIQVRKQQREKNCCRYTAWKVNKKFNVLKRLTEN